MNERFITHFENFGNNEFANPNATGPFWAATFIAPGYPARIKVLQAEIFNNIRPFVEGVGKLLVLR